MGALEFNRSVPGMIEPMEQEMLLEIAKRDYTGAGEIVEIGSFAGLSTSCLAEGLRRNPKIGTARRIGRIHVYDTFTFPQGKLGKVFRDLIPGALQTGPDFRPALDNFRLAFDSYTSPWRDLLDVHAGDAAAATWNGKPIEILFIDCAAGLDFHVEIARKFYPALAVNGILIHQDWFYNRSWYLPALMRAHYPQIAPVATIGTSRIFHKSAITNALGRVQSLQKPSDHEILRFLLDEIECERDQPKHQEILACALIRFISERYGLLSSAFQSNLLDAVDTNHA